MPAFRSDLARRPGAPGPANGRQRFLQDAARPGLMNATKATPEILRNKNPGWVFPNHRQRVRMATASPNILVVEDDRETRALIAKYLRTNACNVTTATDGREMVRAMTDHRVDLVILDVMLPGEDGLSLCRKVRARIADADHHAHRARRGRRPHSRPRDGRGRLPRQAVQSARIAGADQRGAAPPGRRPDRQRHQWRDRARLPRAGGSISACGNCAIRRARGSR